VVLSVIYARVLTYENMGIDKDGAVVGEVLLGGWQVSE
jgi:hypothetical protein